MIIGFIGDIRTFLGFMQACKHIHRVYKFNVVWNNFLQQSFPKVVKYIQDKNSQPDISKVNLRNIVQSSSKEMMANLDHWLAELSKIKETANKLFSEGKIAESIEEYDKISEHSTTIKNTLRENPFFEAFSSMSRKIELYKLIIVLNANCSQAAINEEKYGMAYNSSKKANKYLNIIKKMIPQTIFEENFDMLSKKILHRLDTSRAEIMPLFRFYRYSEVPVDELRVGTLLTASDNISGDIFCDSKVLLYEYEAGEGVAGVIINKQVTKPDGEVVRIGGPCEIRTTSITLHNIPNVISNDPRCLELDL